jgi:hypothetical protein
MGIVTFPSMPGLFANVGAPGTAPSPNMPRPLCPLPAKKGIENLLRQT